MPKLPFALPLVVLLAVPSMGCLAAMATDMQISATREASGVFDTIGDYEVARGAAEAGLVQFEGMHRLRPDNTDALFALTQAWVGYGFAFAEDDAEAAQDKGNDDLAEYHKRRAHMAYDRAVFYGLELMTHADRYSSYSGGFKEAKKNANTMKAWLKQVFTKKEECGMVFWTAYAWMARTNLDKDDPAVVADLYVGEAMMERAVELDPSYNFYNGEVALAAYHVAVSNVVEGKKIFELALEKTKRKNLMVQFTYAQTYACETSDRPLYEALMKEIIDAGDIDPEERLENAIAKRKARRYLGKARMQACGFEMSPSPAAAPATAVPAKK
ncbi:MAG: TRAP transporter TatT component family protein [Polyangiaceae bacterium]